MVLLSVMPINHLGIEYRFGNRKGEKGMEIMKKNRQGKESQKEREAGPSLFVTVIANVAECLKSHSSSLSCTLRNPLSESFAEHEHNV